MSQVLTTDSVSPRDRLDYWREIICAVYVKLDAEPARGGGGFSGSVAWSPWGQTTISRVVAEAQVVTRQLDSGSNDCLLSLQLRGTGAVTQAARTAVLHPGDFALYDATQPYQLTFEAAFDQLVVQFPRDALIARNVHIESAVARANPGDNGVGAVVASFVRALSAHGPEIGDSERAQLGNQVVDFAAIALSADPPDASVRELNRQRILTYVNRQLHDPALTVASVARAFGVSTRTVQKLFARDDLHLGQRIKQARLERAREALRNPGNRHQTITVIATDNGFAGPTQFARAFRAAFGCSPTDYRNENGVP
jgi:AraC-like DNA-binding protein